MHGPMNVKYLMPLEQVARLAGFRTGCVICAMKTKTCDTKNTIRTAVQPIKQKLFIPILMQHVSSQHAIIWLKHVTELTL